MSSKSAKKRVQPAAGRMEDLPPELKSELKSRLAEADRGEGMLPADEAMDDIRRRVDEILAVASDPRPAE